MRYSDTSLSRIPPLIRTTMVHPICCPTLTTGYVAPSQPFEYWSTHCWNTVEVVASRAVIPTWRDPGTRSSPESGLDMYDSYVTTAPFPCGVSTVNSLRTSRFWSSSTNWMLYASAVVVSRITSGVVVHWMSVMDGDSAKDVSSQVRLKFSVNR